MVDEALEAMLDVVKSLNDVMHASFIVGFTCTDMKTLGRLLKRDQLQMTKLKRNINGNRTSSAAMNVVNRLQINSKSVEVFLFEKAILICKRKSDDSSSVVHLNNLYTPQTPTNPPQPPPQLTSNSTLSSVSSTNGAATTTTTPPTQPGTSTSSSSNSSSLSSASSATFNGFQYFYQFKEMVKTNEIGLTENLKNDKKKFEIWSETSSYIFEAPNEQEKQQWIVQVKNLLENQLNEMKCKLLKSKNYY